MNWFNLLIVAPLVGLVAMQLLLQGLLSLTNLIIALIVLVKGIIPSKNFLAATLASCIAALIFFSLLIVGTYVLTVKIGYAPTPDELAVGAGVAILSALYVVPRMWLKIKHHYRTTVSQDK